MSHPRATRQWLDPLRRADWLTCERAVAWGTVLFCAELSVVVFLALWQHSVFTRVPNPPSSDFVSFYAAGKLALAGTPELVYDHSAHWAAEQAATWAGAGYQYFYYPPIFLLLCAPLTTLPYFISYAAFECATALPFLLVMREILRAKGWQWLLPLLAFPAVFWNLGLGQNAFLTASLFGGFTLLLDDAPLIAGALLGMLSYKPHLALLAPVALLCAGQWRVITSAAITVAALIAVSVLMFGWGAWIAYVHAFAGSEAVYQSGAIDFAGIVTPMGAVRMVGASPGMAYAFQGVVTALVAVATSIVWWRSASGPLRKATLLAGTLLAVPLALLYDQMLLLIAIAWFLRDAEVRGFMGWERFSLLLIWPASLASWPVATAWHCPLGLLTTTAVLSLCLRRTCLDHPAHSYFGPASQAMRC